METVTNTVNSVTTTVTTEIHTETRVILSDVAQTASVEIVTKDVKLFKDVHAEVQCYAIACTYNHIRVYDT